MDWKEVAITLLSLVSAGIAWFLSEKNRELKELHSELKEIRRDFNDLSLKVVGEFVSKADLAQVLAKLDRIEEKIDKKADKD